MRSDVFSRSVRNNYQFIVIEAFEGYLFFLVIYNKSLKRALSITSLKVAMLLKTYVSNSKRLIYEINFSSSDARAAPLAAVSA